ncbi:hypothetical protein OC842_005018 [Tilletia horrida]|uniref:Uncharacterized protein n=1 Tax=Tilletia horrida TaxID=155126 RepID=A0AAN6G8K8_9BASI|nr:hypothetical protein OC842_005018 [Tilletia horrida]
MATQLNLVSLTEASRPIGLVERLQATMENIGVGSLVTIGALLSHPYHSDADFLDRFHRRAQLMLNQIPTLSQRIQLRPCPRQGRGAMNDKKGKAKMEPHMVTDRQDLLHASNVLASSIVPILPAHSRGATWDAILPLARQSAQQRIDLAHGPLWAVDFFKEEIPSPSSSSTFSSSSSSSSTSTMRFGQPIYVLLTFSHALVDGRGARNMLDALISSEPLLLSELDIAPVYPTFESNEVAKLTYTVILDLLKTAFLALLPLFLKHLLHLSPNWPNHISKSQLKTLQADGVVHTCTTVLDRDQVLGLKAAAKASEGRCTLHATINEALKIATIVADRSNQRRGRQSASSEKLSGSSSSKKDGAKSLLPLRKRLRYRFASQNPIDMRTSDDAFGRYSGNIFGMKVLHLSNRTDVPFWSEAAAFHRSISSPQTRSMAAATPSILKFIPRIDGWTNERGEAPVLYTGWESFFELAFRKKADLAGTCNYSNLGLISQPKPVPVVPSAVLPPTESAVIPVTQSTVDALTWQENDSLSDIAVPSSPSGSSSAYTYAFRGNPISTTSPRSDDCTTASSSLPASRSATVINSSLPSSPRQAVKHLLANSASFTQDDAPAPAPATAATTLSSASGRTKARAALPKHEQQQQQQQLCIREVFFNQTAQPGSCAFFIDVAGCAATQPSPSPSPSAATNSAVGGAVTISLTWFDGFLPPGCAEAFLAALRCTLDLCARGAVGAGMSVAEVVGLVEEQLGVGAGAGEVGEKAMLGA